MQQSQAFSLMLIEVNHFKLLLEQYGLTGANLCINAFAKHLSHSAQEFTQRHRSKNMLTIYHIADANFAIVYTEQDCSVAIDQLLSQMHTRLSQMIDTPYGEMRMNFTSGVTQYPSSSNSYNELLLHANIALEEADKRNTSYGLFDQQSGEKHARRMHIARSLETAIEKQQFVLYFQPKMKIKSQTIDSCECLIRWFDDGEFISPAQFIPIAEHSGFILPLGEWILDTAFAQAKAWHEQGLHIRLAINISARQFTQQDFVAGIKERLQRFAVPAELIELEITETAIMDDEEFGISVLQALSALGISLSIDDFGTGYSSLGYLQRFPVNKLKIDQSFVRNMASDKRDQALVLSICQLAKNLGLDIIAEGVEEHAQLEKLKEYNCDQIQGYLLSRPIPADEFEAFLAKGVSF
ncbi:putative bifunctional diguanylate cyclase/phosphodiesterase [Pseudoalteromonas espejiana]